MQIDTKLLHNLPLDEVSAICVPNLIGNIANWEEIYNFSKENKNLKILGGIMGDDILDVAGVKNVATLPTLDEARAKIVGILRSPAQKIASI